MRLALSTAAAPELTLAELVEACGRRGLAGLELMADHAHGVAPDLDGERLMLVQRTLQASDIAVVALPFDRVDSALSAAAAQLSAALGAPVVLSRSGVVSLTSDRPTLRDRASRAVELYADAGGVLLFEHGSDPAHVAALHALVEAEGPDTLGLAWEIDPVDPRFGRDTADILEASGTALRHIRLRGGGPEAAAQEGLGIGALMARLALAGYDGDISVAPSTDRYRVAWSTWLGRGGGWGCGSKAADDSLVLLDPATVNRGEG